MKIRIRILSVLAPLIALFTAVLICSAILNFIDRDPVETFRSMFEYGTSGKSIVSIINRSVPLYISAVAVAVGFKMGLFNIGVEGQYLLGALLAAAFGSYFALPPAIHILFILFVASLSSEFIRLLIASEVFSEKFSVLSFASSIIFWRF